jgi:cell division protein FtsI/penicillin-binding protein 2
MNDGQIRRRCLLVTVFFTCVLMGLGSRLALLHFRAGSQRVGLVDRKTIEQTVRVRRGAIVDCIGRDGILAIDLSVHDVCADPQVISRNGTVDQLLEQVGKIVDIERDRVRARLVREDRRFAYVARFVRDPVVREVRTLGMEGVFFEEALRRHYPHHNFMCHVLGFTNLEGKGCAGIEQSCDRFLRGSSGLYETEVDGRRHRRYDRRTLHIAPQHGANVHLTIDQQLQYMAERALDRVVEQHAPLSCHVIIQRVATGEILAMVSRPGYDLNDYRNVSAGDRLNRSIGVVFEPGSTLKAATVAAALNEGVVTPDSRFFCENGLWSAFGRPLRDSHGYGELTVRDIVKKSSNIGSAKIAIRLGKSRLARYLSDFGLGQRTGIDLPGEEHGILHPVGKWPGIAITRISIGQGVAVTGIQLLGVYCTIANEGVRMRPYVIKKVVDPAGNVLRSTRPEVLSRPITRRTAGQMRDMLERVTEKGGTGRRAAVEGVRVAGKTGTAQKPEHGGYSETNFVASFVGFVPADAPEIGILVVVDDPAEEYYGGLVAAPAFREIAAEAVRYLDISASGVELAGRTR